MPRFRLPITALPCATAVIDRRGRAIEAASCSAGPGRDMTCPIGKAQMVRLLADAPRAQREGC